MIDLAANLVVEQVLEHSVYGHLMARQGNHQPGGAHQGVYACSEPDQWVAVRVASDDAWRGLREHSDRRPGRSIRGSTPWPGARACADLLDAELASWVAGQSQKEALSTLRAAGVDAEAVVHSYDVDLDEQMNARGYWEEVTHPIVGPKRFPAWPMRYASRTSAVVPATGAAARPAQRRGAGKPGHHRGRTGACWPRRASSAPDRSGA